MIGGGTGPADGTNATTCTPGPWNLKMMLKAKRRISYESRIFRKGKLPDEAPPLNR